MTQIPVSLAKWESAGKILVSESCVGLCCTQSRYSEPFAHPDLAMMVS